MKIIKDNDVITINCTHCQSTLEINKRDLQYFYNFGHCSYLYVDCAVCGKMIQIKNDSISASWRQFVNNLIISISGED